MPSPTVEPPETLQDSQLPPPPPSSDRFVIQLNSHQLIEFKIWQENNTEDGHPLLPQLPNALIIRFQIHEEIIRRYYNQSSSQEDSESWTTYFEDVEQRPEINLRLWVEPDLLSLQSDDHLQSSIAAVLSDNAGVPADVFPQITPRLSSFARAVRPVTCKGCGDVVRMFELSVRMMILLEFNNDEPNCYQPAAKSSIEALERVKVEDSGSMECAICLDEIPLGFEVARMPCSHMYHDNCIVRWLERSRYCPLCRFPLPS